jgi:hypothetical protein
MNQQQKSNALNRAINGYYDHSKFKRCTTAAAAAAAITIITTTAGAAILLLVFLHLYSPFVCDYSTLGNLYFHPPLMCVHTTYEFLYSGINKLNLTADFRNIISIDYLL